MLTFGEGRPSTAERAEVTEHLPPRPPYGDSEARKGLCRRDHWGTGGGGPCRPALEQHCYFLPSTCGSLSPWICGVHVQKHMARLLRLLIVSTFTSEVKTPTWRPSTGILIAGHLNQPCRGREVLEPLDSHPSASWLIPSPPNSSKIAYTRTFWP